MRRLGAYTSAVDAVVSSVTNALVAVTVVRSLGVDEVADFALFYGLIQMLVSAYRFTIGDGLLVQSRSGRISSAVTRQEWAFLLGSPALLVALALSPLADDRRAWLAGAAGMAIALSLDAIRYRLFAENRAALALAADTLWLIGMIVGIGAGIALGWSATLTSLLVLWSLSGLIATVAVFFRAGWMRSDGDAWRSSRQATSWPNRIMLSDFAIAGAIGYAIPLFGWLTDDVVIVASWQVSVTIFAPLTVLVSAGRLVWLPRMADAPADGDRTWLLRLGLKLSGMFGFGALIATILIWTMPTGIAEFGLGENWSDYRPLVTIFAIAHGFRLGTSPLVDIVRMANRGWLQVRTRAMNLVVLLFALALSVPFASEVSAAAITGSTIVAWLLWLLSTQDVPWKPVTDALDVEPHGLGAAATAWAIVVVAGVGASIALYPAATATGGLVLAIVALARRMLVATGPSLAREDVGWIRGLCQPWLAVPFGIVVGLGVALGTGAVSSVTDLLGPDAFRYEEQANALAAGEGWGVLEGGKELLPGAWWLLIEIGMGSRTVVAMLSLLTGLLAAVSIRKTTTLAFGRAAGDRALAIALLSPAYMVFVAQPLREGFIALGAAWTLHGMVLLVRVHRLRAALPWLAAGVGTLAFSRPIVLIVLLGAYVIVGGAGLVARGFDLRFILRAIPVVAMVAAALIVKPAGIDLAAQLDWDEANAYRVQVASTADTGLIETSDIDGFGSAFSAVFNGGVRLLTRPTVFDLRSPVDVVATVDTLVFVLTVAGALRFFTMRKRDGAAWLLFLAAGGVLTVASIAAVDIGLLLRLRGLVMLLLAPLAGAFLASTIPRPRSSGDGSGPLRTETAQRNEARDRHLVRTG